MVTVLTAIVLAVAMFGQSWHVASFYETPMKKGRRIADLHPATPHVWERAAWSCYRAERYDEAIALAEREFVHEGHRVRSDAQQVIAMSQFRLGDHDAAFESLQRAIDANPKDTQAKFYLAKILEEVGRTEEALGLLEESVADAPLANPRILRLASLYRHLGRRDDARRMYEQVLRNNPYDVPAAMNLAELDIEDGTPEAFRATAERLVAMLEWMPENADAWVNLGVVHSALGRTSEAIDAYGRALAQDPRHATAALNLAMIHQAVGETDKAAALFVRAAECGLGSVQEVGAVHDFYVANSMAPRAVDLWDEFLARYPDSVDARAFRAWSRALAGDVPRARLEATKLCTNESTPPLAHATLGFAALVEEQYPIAVEQTDALCATGEQGTDARQRFLRRLEMFGHRKPGVAWTYCLAAELLVADGQLDGARIGADLCAQLCSEPGCRDRVTSLRARLSGAPSTTAPPPDTP